VAGAGTEEGLKWDLQMGWRAKPVLKGDGNRVMVVELTPLMECIHGEESVSAVNAVQRLLTAGGLVPVERRERSVRSGRKPACGGRGGGAGMARPGGGTWPN
jgi:hypothetical protein